MILGREQNHLRALETARLREADREPRKDLERLQAGSPAPPAPSRQKPLDFTQVQTISLRKRRCRLSAEMLAKPPDPAVPLQEFYRSLPRLGAATELLRAAETLTQAGLAERGIIWLVDASAIDAGLSPLIIKLIQKGLARAVALTGGAAARDFELAVNGITAEDVTSGLREGLLGMSRETGEGMNQLINEGVKRGFGIGECLGRGILNRQPRYYAQSIMAACSARMAACTVHVSIGADGFHCHPTAEGPMLGKGSLRDLQLLGMKTEELHEGGVIVSLGAGPVLWEIFYSALSAARNLGATIDRFSLIQFDPDTHDYADLAGLNAAHEIRGPRELTFPLFCGAVLSLVA